MPTQYPSATNLCGPIVYRTDDSKMPKNLSVSTSMRSKKSCSHYSSLSARRSQPVQSSRPSHAYSMESSARSCAWQASPTLSQSKAGDLFNSTSRFVIHPFFPFRPCRYYIWRLTSELFLQSDSVHTIQDALAHISQPQSVPVSPSGPSKANQQVTVLIEAVPPVLVLHLKRFLYDAATAGGVVKIAKPVRFSPELEVPSGTISISARDSGPRIHRGCGPGIIASAAGQLPVPARYTLCGVLYHQGASASRGHYTVDVLHPNAHDGGGEAWLHIDDESVITVRHEDVFGGHDNERAHDESDRCAYMLFYHRATSTET